MPRLAFGTTLASLWMLVGCAQTTDPSAMGNTNWLLACGDDSDCGDDGMCLCGVCSEACDDDPDCDALGGGQCTTLTAVGACDAAPVPQACLAQCGDDVPCPPGTLCDEGSCVGTSAVSSLPPLSRTGAVVFVPEAYRGCTQDADCIEVSVVCDGCCQSAAIHVDHRPIYDVNFRSACADWSFGICNCQPPFEAPRCVDNLCQMVPREDVCFSPTRNVERAYDGRPGCRCEQEGADICVPPAALSCQPSNEGFGSVWQAGEDGACALADATCEAGTIVPSAADCLANFLLCWALPDGRFCGTLPPGPEPDP